MTVPGDSILGQHGNLPYFPTIQNCCSTAHPWYSFIIHSLTWYPWIPLIPFFTAVLSASPAVKQITLTQEQESFSFSFASWWSFVHFGFQNKLAWNQSCNLLPKDLITEVGQSNWISISAQYANCKTVLGFFLFVCYSTSAKTRSGTLKVICLPRTGQMT